jgi:hypothetical protein
MPDLTIKNTSDQPLCITDPDTGEVYCVLPGYILKVSAKWPDVKSALNNMRAQVVSAEPRRKAN